MQKQVIEARKALDSVIQKSRVHLYKPIQIAEILYRHRANGDINLLNLEDYRNASKKWRDDICIPLLGRKCTSSAKFQDNLFERNAIPPEVLNILGKENLRTNGAVEAYIYHRFTRKYTQLSSALDYCSEAKPTEFDVKKLINSFWNEQGLKRSLDKIYEIIVYALFTTLVDAMNLQVEISIGEKAFPLLKEFEDFSIKIMCIDTNQTRHIQDAAVYRVGVTNAADRGLDMYSNWGPAIQIKHLSLDVELAENIVDSMSIDKVIIVCKDAEKDVILSLLTQIGWRIHIQSIVTENDIVNWYEKALRGRFSSVLAEKLLNTLVEEITQEFPSLNELPEALAQRGYDNIDDDYWS